ncbi:Condensation domain-containing protein [Amycolatopsis xylanica]|uniref:Condensation domain-containing protein n=1 Tax=Amycolatopsis xylanica TaxID=589385 RepID=A0A1H3SCY9_9PSEU|nr:condensation domain-containing protein [Amycolatopsis xylanica]SDZ35774.1 Condensation domain-containing protein [Amycolatopsis xylanica]
MTGPFELSAPQQYMWENLRFLNPADPGSTSMNQVLTYRITGEFDVPRMERAFNILVSRHDALRLTLTDLGVQPRQRVTPRLIVPLSLVDLTHLPREDREPAAAAYAAEADSRPFDLVNGPLIHPSVCKLAETDHVLVFTLNHLVTDGWSAWVLRKELTALYAGDELPALAGSYQDFAGRPCPNAEASVEYWTRRLEDAPPSLDLPTDRPRASMDGCDNAFHIFTIDTALAHAAAGLARRSRVSLYVLFLSAYQALLHLKTGQRDIVIGSVFAQRTDSTTIDLMGLFNNVVFFRAAIDPAATFTELLVQLSRTARDAYAHAAPFPAIARSLHSDFDAARPWPAQNLYHAWLQFDVPPITTRMLGGLFAERFQYDLTDPPAEAPSPAQHRLMAKENPSFELRANGTGGLIQYNSRLFDEETIIRLAQDLANILAAVTKDPDTRIADLPCGR